MPNKVVKERLNHACLGVLRHTKFDFPHFLRSISVQNERAAIDLRSMFLRVWEEGPTSKMRELLQVYTACKILQTVIRNIGPCGEAKDYLLRNGTDSVILIPIDNILLERVSVMIASCKKLRKTLIEGNDKN